MFLHAQVLLDSQVPRDSQVPLDTRGIYSRPPLDPYVVVFAVREEKQMVQIKNSKPKMNECI